ncbi:hypothetical protein FNF27_01895 [Cafeteria roenbergensis]|uniref:Cadherin domain-containing protein n=1 Tax=Cafeteria roenbergensis TaxID=33653 RepID=A0A5A8EH58_CAFRO|nr:hypothetical protein FNF27_01895 [Cafeteria roenbergensis]
MQRVWLWAAVAALPAAWGSHFRFGNINWRAQSSSVVLFDFTSGWRNYISGSIGSKFTPGSLYFGDGQSTSPTFTVTSLSTTDDWIVGPAPTISHTYTVKTVTAAFYGCCRIAMAGPLSNQYWRVETKVDLNPTPGGWINASPVSSGVPIIDVYRNVLNSWTVPAADNDGDKLSYRLATKYETTGSSSSGGNPTGMTASDGLIQWQPTSNGLYGSQVIVEDAYSSVAVDYILRVQDPQGSICNSGQPNANPVFVSPSPWIDQSLPSCFQPGSKTTFTVRASDPVDTCDTLLIQSGSLPVGASISKSSGSNPVNYLFTWTPSQSNAGNHVACFLARDAIGGVSKQECITLYVPNVGSLKPTVSSVSPQKGETESSTAITLKGSNFERGSGLYCRFSFESVSDKTLVQAIYISATEIVCLAPKQPSGAGTKLTLEVSNLASCDAWVTALNNVDFFYLACPPGSTMSGPTCSECPKGTYQAGGSAGGEDECTDCPAGRYGDSLGLKSPLCSGECPKGYYCPSGTSSRLQYPCPAGTYGSTTGLTSSACSGLTSAGYYSTSGAVSATEYPCAAGRYGSGGQTSSQCSGPCSAGQYCPQGTASGSGVDCGSAAVFCPEGSSAPSTVADGYYSFGGESSAVRTGSAICEKGYYCSNGERSPCPAGRFGSTEGLSSPACSGPCTAGFLCPSASTSSTAEECDVDGSGDVYCPEGTAVRRSVSTGYYSSPLSAPASQRSAQTLCEEQYVCISGERKPKVEWTGGCRATTDLEEATGGILGGADFVALFSLDENGPSTKTLLGSLTAVSNQQGAAAAVSYTVVSTRPSPSSTCSSTAAVTLEAFSTSRRVYAQGPLDFEQCSKFELLVRATGGTYSIDCAVTVDVNDKNDAPKVTASSTSRSVAEDGPRNGLVGGPMLGVEVSDEDAGQELSFSIVSGDAGIFTIGSCSGQLSLAVDNALDYEQQSSYSLTVRARDDHPTDPKEVTIAVTVQVTDVNEAPRFDRPARGTSAFNSSLHFDLVVDENSPAGAALSGSSAGPSASDPDTPTASSSNTLTYSIRAQDPELFAIDAATGAMSVSAAVGSGAEGAPAAVDFENLVGGEVAVTVRVSDELGLSDTQTFLVRVSDLNDPPVVPQSVNVSLAEGSAVGAEVTDSVTASDEDRPSSPVTFAIASEQLFVRSTGEWETTSPLSAASYAAVRDGDLAAHVAVSAASTSSVALDFERVSAARLLLRATDSPHLGLPSNQRDTLVTVELSDVNERPFFVGPAGSAAASEAARASLPASPSAPYVAPPPRADTIVLNVSELASPGLLVGGLASFDPDTVAAQTLFVTAVSGSGSSVFGINTQGNVTLIGDPAVSAGGAVLDFERTQVYRTTVRVTDSGSPPLSDTAVLEVRVMDEQEPPAITAGQTFTIDENAGAGTAVSGGAVAAVDPDAADNVGAPGAGLTFEVRFGGDGDLTPALRSDSSKPLFDIDSATGQLRVSASAVAVAGMHELSDVNHELVARATVSVRVTDTAGNSHTANVVVTVNDLNERPADPSTTQRLAVAELSPVGTAVGALVVSDVDDGDSVAVVLEGVVPPAVPGAQDACASASLFELDPSLGAVAGALRLKSAAPTRPLAVDDATQFGFGCNVTFKGQDAAGLLSPLGYAWVELVRNNEPPTYNGVLPTTISVPESTAGGSVLLASLGATDPNEDQTLSHSIRAVRPDALLPVFSLQAGGAGALSLRPGFSLDHETTPSVSVTVETRDDGLPTGLKTTAVITITVTDVPESPVLSIAAGATGGGMAVDENSAAGTAVGSMGATDQDASETLTFSIAPRAGSGVPAAALPFEVHPSTGAITVRSVAEGAAAAGLSHEAAAEWAVTVTVTDKDDLTDTMDFSIAVNDVNEPCTATVGPASAAFAVNAGAQGGAAASVWAVAQVSETAAPGTAVAVVTAADPDDPEHPLGWGRLSYRVVPSPAQAGAADEASADAGAAAAPYSTSGTAEVFEVSPSGVVSVAALLDFEDQERHDVVVEVLDGDSGAPLGVNVTVSIRVVDSPLDTAVDSLEGALLHPSAGGDDLDFVGQGLGATARRLARAASGADAPAPSYTFTALAVGQPDGRKYNSTTCAQSPAGDNSRVRCATPPGYGTAWAWTLRWSAAYTGDATAPLGGDAAVLHDRTSVQPPTVSAVLQGLRSEPTAGGSVLEVEGSNFGPLSAPVTVRFGASTGMELAAVGCAVSVAHTRVRCTTVAGVGTGLGVVVGVAGQLSARFEPQPPALPLGYAAPAVSGIVVLSASADPRDAVPLFSLGASTAALTTSGQSLQIVLQGTNFGAQASTFSLRFGGGAGRADKYLVSGAALDCSVVVSHTVVACDAPAGQGVGLRVAVEGCRVTVSGARIECTTAEGVGAELGVWLAVDGVDPLAAWGGAPAALPAASFPKAVSYHPPVVTGYEGPGASEASTVGGADWYVDVTGRNFGPVGHGAVDSVTYAKPAIAAGTEPGVIFEAACTVRDAHTRMRCNISQGAGQDLAWNVTVRGQLSVEPVTSYDEPSIASFAGAAAPLAADQPASGFATARAAPDGNETVSLVGLNFGPPSRSAEYLEWVRFAPATLANASRVEDVVARGESAGPFYTGRNCRVVSHSEVQCTMPPASGGPHFWTARVKGQTSASSPAFYMRRPRPLFIEPAARTGSSAASLPLVQGPAALLRTTGGGQTVRVVGRWFGLKDPFADVFVRWGGLTLRPSAQYRMSVPSSLVAAAEAGTAFSWSASGLSPSAPSVVLDALEVTVPEGFGQDIPVRVVTASLAGDVVSLSTDLSFTYAAPTLSFPSVREDTDNPLTKMFMLLRGANLCRPPVPGFDEALGDPPLGSVTALANCARVQVMNEDDPDPAMRAVYRTLGPSEVVSHTHEEVVLHIARGRGSARVDVAGRVTNEVRFEQLAPGFLEGECDRFEAYAFRTIGWTGEDPSQLLTVRAYDICNASLAVTVGGADCTHVTFPPLLVGTDEGTGKRICEVSCRVPQGQGASNEVVVVNGGMASDHAPGATPCVVAYGKPSVTEVYSRLDGLGDALPASSTATVDALGREPRVLTGVRLVSAAGSPPAGAFVRPGQAVATPYAPQAGLDKVVTLPTEGGRIVVFGDSLGTTAFSDLASATTVTMQPDGASRLSTSDGPVLLDAVSEASGGLGHNHTLVELEVPPTGTGRGWVLSLLVSGQALPSYLGLAFAPPSVESAAPMRVRTQGGQILTVRGRNFGQRADRVSVLVGGRACTSVTLAVAHRELRCVVPEGAGPAAAVEVTVDGQSSGTAHGVSLAYLPPVVTSVWPASVGTDGSEVVTITGDNLGRTSPLQGGSTSGRALADALLAAAVSLVPVGGRSTIDLVRTVPDPDAGTPFAHDGAIISHNHTHIVFRAPQIQGASRTIRVTVAGQSTLDAAQDATLGSPAELALGIRPPQLDAVDPLVGPTNGYLVRFRGESLGRVEPLRSPSLKSDNRGLAVQAVAPGGELRLPCTPVSTAGGQWAREYAAWDFVDPATGERPPRPSSPYTHEWLFCLLPRGFGQNITLEVSLDGIPASSSSAVSRFSYAPPEVLTLVPNQPSANGRKGAFVQGGNFGAESFGDATNSPTVKIGELACTSPELVSDERIDCDTQRDTVGVKVLEVSTAGYSNMRYPDEAAAAAGTDVWRVEAVCPIETYGQPGETCADCPQGGVCEGAVCEVEAPAGRAASCIQFREPYASPGFWQIAQPAELCPESRQSRPAPFNGSCPAFMPCDPKAACLGRNVCAEGYQGERCGECLPGKYYRSNGVCIQCPDNVWLFPVLFAMLVIVVACGAYVLHRLDTQVEGFGTALFVAVDHMQVLSILAKTRVKWPSFLADLLSWLSVFQFNIDIVGLDCAMPELGYEMRWLGTELLPIAFLVIFGLLHAVLWLYKGLCMGQNRIRRNDHLSSLISTSVLLFYVLYLQVTRTAFDALNCMSLDPPDGYTYLEAVFERCGTGMQARIAPLAYVFIGLYTVGFLVFTAVLLRRYKEDVKVDQILRAMDVSTKQNGLDEFRARWSRLYMHFVPGQAPYWIVLLLIRKALVAVAALVFGRVPSFQLACIMLILFVAFTMNARSVPYMSYARRREVVLQHRAKVREGDKMHKTIAHTYQRAIADRSIASRVRSTGLSAMASAATAADARRARLVFAARWSGDPNNMETVLLFVSMLIALTGILMESGETSFQYVAVQRDLIAYAAMVLLVVAVLYAFGVVAVEVFATFLRGSASGGCSCCSSANTVPKGDTGKPAKHGKDALVVKRAKGKGKGKGGSPQRTADPTDLEPVLREMEREALAALSPGLSGDGSGFHVNPMAAEAFDVSAAGDDLDAIISADTAPTASQWAVVRKHAEKVVGSMTELQAVIDDLKEKQAARKRHQAAKRGGARAGRSPLARSAGGSGDDFDDDELDSGDSVDDSSVAPSSGRAAAGRSSLLGRVA